ncbi:MAG: radical SAM protein [Ruminococcus sp.]|nr:radical SAM protein [Ruminococcus sp.]
MDKLLLYAHIVELTPTKILIISFDTGKWFVTDARFQSVFNMIDGTNTLDDIKCKSCDISCNEIEQLYNTLNDLEMLHPAKTGCNHIACEPKTPNHVVMNLTEQCNINCLYCYVDASPTKSCYMSPEMAVRVASEMLKLNVDNDKKITFVFHGGEPTLNLDALDAVCSFLLPYKERVSLSIQTNATNISDRLISLIKTYDISVGVSMDGYGELHDKTRVDFAGKGTFNRVLQGINRLQDEGIAFGILTVLNSNNYKHTGEILDYYASLGVHSVAFLRLTEIGRENEHPELLISGEQIFEAFKDIIEWLIDYNSTHSIPMEERTISKIAKIISTGKRDYMCMRKPCGAGRETLGIDTTGKVYACDNMVGQSEFYMGDLKENDLKTIIDNSSVLGVINQSVNKMIDECGNCCWKNLCSEVCSAQYYMSQHAEITDEPECLFHKKIIPEILKRFCDKPSIFELLCPELITPQPKKYYFNILYNCNSHCIFCAADHDINPSSYIITLDMLSDLIKLHNIKKDDIVIINGGEPTLNPELIEMIELLSAKQVLSVIYTNGRRLADPDFCKSLIQAGISKISIPVFGDNADTHDYCTGAKGSFDETVEGIKNIIRFKKECGSNLELEIKLLSIKCLLEENPKIIKWISKEFPSVDIISLNALIVSETVYLRKEKLLPDFDSWSNSVNKCIAAAREYSVIDKIFLNDTPYCLLDKCNYDLLSRYLTLENINLLPKDMLYIDYNNLVGTQTKSFLSDIPDSCRSCLLLDNCEFINRVYGDSKVAQASMEMLS